MIQHVTRRAFLTLSGAVAGLVAGLRRSSSPAGSQERDDERAVSRLPRVQYSMPGNATEHGATIASRLVRDRPGAPGRFAAPVPGYELSLLVGTSADEDGNPLPPYLDPVETRKTNADGMVRHVVSSGQPGTHYYARLAHGVTRRPSWTGFPIEFTTHPAASDGFSMAIAVGSCQRWWQSTAGDGTTISDPNWQVAWRDLQWRLHDPNARWRPDKLWDIGDFHYKGGAEKAFGADVRDWRTWARMYWSQLDGLPEMAAARALVVEDQIADDHEFGANNCDSGLQEGHLVGGALCRSHQMDAMSRVFAYPELANNDDPRAGLWYSYQINARVRVVVLDGESTGRTLGKDDGPSATFLGHEQDAWLRRTLLQPAVLNILLCGKAWIGEVSHRVG
jgi:phosphodiesterase/alkaline phosphatase D-like protein